MQKECKNWPSAHHRTTLSGYIFTTKACIDNREKNVKQQYLLHMPSQYGELRPTNGRDRLACLGHPSKFQQGSRLGFVTAATSLNGSQPNFAQCLAVCWLVYYIYTFRYKIHFASKSCVLLFWQCYCMALEQWTSAKLCGMVQGIELWNFRSSFSTEGAIDIPRVAITLGIGPYSSII